MKKIYNVFMLAAASLLSLTGCSDKEPFTTAGPDDTPIFLSPSSIIKNVQVSQSQKRDETYSMDVVVTPADYTTVSWISDGHVLATGTSFNHQFEAGEYSVRLEAVTKGGKMAWREILLSVDALDGDPTVDAKAKNRWLNPGKALTIAGSNMADVKSLVFLPVIAAETRAESAPSGMDEQPVPTSETEIPCQAAADGNSVTTTLPEDMRPMQYRLSAVTTNGERFGCDLVTVSNEEYVNPDVEKKILWQGKEFINWGDNNILISAEQLADVKVGTTIRLKYNVPEAEYHALRITTPWWGDEASDNIVAQFDITEETPNPFEFVYTAACQQLVEERGGMLIVGFGYEALEVSYDAPATTAEMALWEGKETINWGDNNILITAEQLADIEAGTTIKLFYNVPEAEYHALRITTPQWGDNAEDNLVQQFDITEETPNPFEFVYTAACKRLVEERGGMLIVGFGYTVTKVSAIVAAAPETTVWEGSEVINWGDNNVLISADQLAEAKDGATISLYFDVPEAEYHALRVTTPQWGDNAEDNLVQQFDITEETPNPYEFKYTAACRRLVEGRGGMLIVGFGYKLKKVTVK